MKYDRFEDLPVWRAGHALSEQVAVPSRQLRGWADYLHTEIQGRCRLTNQSKQVYDQCGSALMEQLERNHTIPGADGRPISEAEP